MAHGSPKQVVTIRLDQSLIDAVKAITPTLTHAVEEALRAWLASKLGGQQEPLAALRALWEEAEQSHQRFAAEWHVAVSTPRHSKKSADAKKADGEPPARVRHADLLQLTGRAKP